MTTTDPELRSWKERLSSALREQHEMLFDSATGTLRGEFAQRAECPLCGQDDAELWCVKDGFRLVRCHVCSMVYLNPRLNDVATAAFYNSRANAIYNETKFEQVSASTELDDSANLLNLTLIHRLNGQPAGRKLLEVGSGKGYFLRRAKEMGYEVFGLELNTASYQRTRQEFGPSIFNADLFQAQFPSDTFDVIYMRDVIEHVPAPRPFFGELSRIAKSGCLLCLETHNIESLINRLVREKHTVIFGFEHPTHWSPRTMRRILRDTAWDLRNIYFTSLDCTLGQALKYILEPSFTTIYPSLIPGRLHLLSRALHKVLQCRPIAYVDARVTPRIANALGKGSVMKVLAKK